jgi:N-acetyl sugar amidotransferase
MDTTDPDITFDEAGVCSHCHRYDQSVAAHVVAGEEGPQRLQVIVNEMKKRGRGKRYDCVMGVSGGVDSSFAALKARELGLRPLAVHLDNGWDSELAVKNVENVCSKLGIDLSTWVLDWEEFKDIQLAFLRASTPDSEIPSDHAILSAVWKTARQHGLRYFVTGYNARTESHLPRAWSQGYFDWRYIASIHRRFGKVPLKHFPAVTFPKLWYYRKTVTMVHILNYVNYRKTDAMPILEDAIGWKYYGGKHYESIYTRFYQGYVLPRKFGFDKRRCHLSSLVCSGEIRREHALKELEKESYPAELQEEDRVYVMKKLGLTLDEFEEIMGLPKKTYDDYPNHDYIYQSPAWQILLHVNNGVRRVRRRVAR